jgi:hypothetical protein
VRYALSYRTPAADSRCGRFLALMCVGLMTEAIIRIVVSIG